MMNKEDVVRTAVVSKCGTYRYQLMRDWSSGKPCKQLTMVMLNPSTGDGERDDATTLACMRIAERFEMKRLAIVNLYAMRATDPSVLVHAMKTARQSNDDMRHRARDSGIRESVLPGYGLKCIGVENDVCIRATLFGSHVVVCGWGTNVERIDGGAGRARDVVKLLRRHSTPYALKWTRDGHPSHPLYLPSDIACPTGNADMEVWP